VPKPIKLLEGIRKGGNSAQQYCEQMINISYFYDLLGSMGNRCCWPPVDLYFVPMLAYNALPPSTNYGLSDWS